MSKTTFAEFAKTHLTEKQLANFIKTEASDWLSAFKANGALIYRGESKVNSLDICVGDSNNFTRSYNTQNWYNMWIDNHPSWKGFPKRLKSYICTNDYKLADDYGTLYCVIPSNSAKIEMCNKDDMWVEFMHKQKDILKKSGSTSLGALNEVIALCSEYTNTPISNDPSNFELFFNDLKNITVSKLEDVINSFSAQDLSAYTKFEIAQKEFDIDHLDKLCEDLRNNNISNLYELMETIISPSVGNTNIVNVRDIHFDKTREIWIQGKCAFVNLENMIDRPHSKSSDTKTSEKYMYDLCTRLNLIG